jgi:hypothetical protein
MDDLIVDIWNVEKSIHPIEWKELNISELTMSAFLHFFINNEIVHHFWDSEQYAISPTFCQEPQCEDKMLYNFMGSLSLLFIYHIQYLSYDFDMERNSNLLYILFMGQNCSQMAKLFGVYRITWHLFHLKFCTTVLKRKCPLLLFSILSLIQNKIWLVFSSRWMNNSWGNYKSFLL